MSMEGQFYIILSQGSYSEYSPSYFIGRRKITQKELDKKSKEVGEALIQQYEQLPERPIKIEYSWQWEGVEKYDPETGKGVYKPGFSEWFPLMEAWLKSEGFSPLPDDIPEKNVNYGGDF